MRPNPLFASNDDPDLVLVEDVGLAEAEARKLL